MSYSVAQRPSFHPQSKNGMLIQSVRMGEYDIGYCGFRQCRVELEIIVEDPNALANIQEYFHSQMDGFIQTKDKGNILEVLKVMNLPIEQALNYIALSSSAEKTLKFLKKNFSSYYKGNKQLLDLHYDK